MNTEGRRTLEEAIKMMDNEQYVKLGSSGGGAFIFCGKCSDLDFEGLDMAITERSVKLIAKYVREVSINKRKLNAPKPAYREYAKTVEKPLPYEEWLPAHISRCEKAIKGYQSAKDRMINTLIDYKRLRCRAVSDIYESILEPNTQIVIVDGTESGVAWTFAEYTELMEKGAINETA